MDKLRNKLVSGIEEEWEMRKQRNGRNELVCGLEEEEGIDKAGEKIRKGK